MKSLLIKHNFTSLNGQIFYTFTLIFNFLVCKWLWVHWAKKKRKNQRNPLSFNFGMARKATQYYSLIRSRQLSTKEGSTKEENGKPLLPLISFVNLLVVTWLLAVAFNSLSIGYCSCPLYQPKTLRNIIPSPMLFRDIDWAQLEFWVSVLYRRSKFLRLDWWQPVKRPFWLWCYNYGTPSPEMAIYLSL